MYHTTFCFLTSTVQVASVLNIRSNAAPANLPRGVRTMPKFRTTVAGIALSTALIAGGLFTAPSANAAEASDPAPNVVDSATTGITQDTIRRAIAEARSAGAIKEEKVNADGTKSVVIEGADGVTLELSAANPYARLATGSDSYGGMYVAFNSFDQNLVISGAMTAIAAGMCALGPAVCAVANVAAVLASTAIGSSGGVRCGTKSLRVYPISHKTPRCA